MEELLSRHELAFSTRFTSLLHQLANEGIGLTLPVVIIEHIYNSESNLGIVKAQARKCAKELSNIVDGSDEEYFDLLKVKEVEFKTEERGVLVRKKNSWWYSIVKWERPTIRYITTWTIGSSED